jgi:hypothetical protein
MSTNRVQDFIDMLSKNKNVQGLMSELTKLSTDITHGREEAVKQAQAKYKKALETLVEKQGQLEKQIHDFREILANRVQTVASSFAAQVQPATKVKTTVKKPKAIKVVSKAKKTLKAKSKK